MRINGQPVTGDEDDAQVYSVGPSPSVPIQASSSGDQSGGAGPLDCRPLLDTSNHTR